MPSELTAGTPSPSVHSLLAQAQAAWQDPVRSAKGRIGTRRYQFVPLTVVLKMVREHLAPVGVSLTQAIEAQPLSEGAKVWQVTAHTVLTGPCGDAIMGATSMPVAAVDSKTGEVLPAPTAQMVGSAAAYARRYGLLGLLGLGQEDDDGAVASNTDTNGGGQKAQSSGDDEKCRWMKPSDPNSEKNFAVSAPPGKKTGEIVEVVARSGSVKKVRLTRHVGKAFGSRQEWDWDWEDAPVAKPQPQPEPRQPGEPDPALGF